MIRVVIVILFLFFIGESTGQTLEKMLVSGSDWRMCGNAESTDTLVFVKVNPNTVAYSCSQNEYLQLLIYEGLSFRMLAWNKEVCYVTQPGMMEMNDDTGEFRFYFEDGTSRDYILIYLDRKKLILVDRNY